MKTPVKFTIGEIQTAVWLPFAAIAGIYPDRLFVPRLLLEAGRRKYSRNQVETWRAADKDALDAAMAKLFAMRMGCDNDMTPFCVRTFVREFSHTKTVPARRGRTAMKVDVRINRPSREWRARHDLPLLLQHDVHLRLIANRVRAIAAGPALNPIRAHAVCSEFDTPQSEQGLSPYMACHFTITRNSRPRSVVLFHAFKADVIEHLLLSILPIGGIE